MNVNARRYRAALDAAGSGEYQRFAGMVGRGVTRRKAAVFGLVHPTICLDCTRSIWRCSCPDPDLEHLTDGHPDGDPDDRRLS